MMSASPALNYGYLSLETLLVKFITQNGENLQTNGNLLWYVTIHTDSGPHPLSARDLYIMQKAIRWYRRSIYIRMSKIVQV